MCTVAVSDGTFFQTTKTLLWKQKYSWHSYYQHFTLNNICSPLTFESHILTSLLVEAS